MKMISKSIAHYLPTPPVVVGYDATQTALTYYLLLASVILLPFSAGFAIFMRVNHPVGWMTMLAMGGISAVLFGLMYQPPYSHLPVRFIGWYSLAIFIILAFLSGGLYTPPFVAMAIPIVLNSFINGRRSAIATFGAVLVTAGLLIYIENAGGLPPFHVTTTQRILGFASYFGLLTLSIEFVLGRLRHAAHEAKRQTAALVIQQQRIQDHDMQLAMLADVAHNFLRGDTWEECMPDVLPLIGNATNVDRVYVYEIIDRPGQEWITNKRFEWDAEGVTNYATDPLFQHYPFRQSGFGRWIDVMSAGGIIVGNIDTFPDSEREFLSSRQIAAQMAVPLYTHDQIWGFIGFDSETPRVWSAAETDVLRALAEAISAAIQQSETRRTLFRVLSDEVQHNETLRRQRFEIEQRDRLFNRLADAIGRLLRVEEWSEAVYATIPDIAQVLGADRLLLHEVTPLAGNNDWRISRYYYWPTEPDLPTLDPNHAPSMRQLGLGRWVDVLRSGESIFSAIDDLPPAEQAFIRPLGSASIGLVPVQLPDGGIWGILTFVAAKHFDFTQVQMDVLRAYADALGTAIQRYDVRQRMLEMLLHEQEHNEALRQQQAQIERRDQLIDMVADVTRRFLRHDDWVGVISDVLPQLCTVAGSDRTYLYEIIGDTGNDWYVRELFGWQKAPQNPQQQAFPQSLSLADIGLARWVAVMRDGGSIISSVDDLPASEQPVLKMLGSAAELVMPIVMGAVPWGFVTFSNETPHHWTPAQVATLQTLADTIGAAAQRAQTRDQMARLLRQAQAQNDILREQQHEIEQRDILLRVLSDTTKRFLQSETWDDVLPTAISDIGIATGVDQIHIFAIDDFSEDAWLVSQRFAWLHEDPAPPLDPDLQRVSVRTIGFGRWGSQIAGGDAIQGHASDFPADEQAFLQRLGIASLLLMPIFVDNLPWGFINYATNQPHEWPAAQLDALKTFADAIGAAIHRHNTRLKLIVDEAEVSAIIRAIPDPVTLIDRDGRYLRIYNSPSSYHAYQLHAYVGKTVHDLWPQDAADAYLQSLRAYLDSHSEQPMIQTYDLTLPHLDRRVMEITSVRWDDNTVLWVGRDVTVAKESEERIQASERLFRAIYHGSPDIMLLIDVDTDIIVEANDALERILRVNKRQVLNLSIQRLFRLADASLPALYQQVSQDGTALGQTTITTSEGRSLPIDVAGALIDLPTGRAVLLTLRDTSERARVAELNALLEKERELNNMRQQFIQTVSHEFRTPLAIIQLSAEILNNYRDRLSEEQRHSRYAMINRQIDYMKTMVENVSRYGDVLQGVVLRPAAIELEPFIRTIVGDIDSLNPQPRIGLTLDIRNPIYYGDPVLLRQVILNLVNNSLRYSKPDQSVFVWLTSHPSEVQIRVVDEGVGIPSDFLRYLYTPFKRAENVQSIGGTGIGLTLTKRIVEQHGGRIMVESKVGQGTTMTVILPHNAIPREDSVAEAPTKRRSNPL